MENVNHLEKRRRSIEALEQFDALAAPTKAAILCVVAGVRPATFFELEYHADQERQYSRERYEADILKLEQIFKELELSTQVVAEEEMSAYEEGGQDFLHLYAQVNVAKTSEALQTLMDAWTQRKAKGESAWDVAMGTALGYPPTAIKAYQEKKYLHAQDFPEEVQDHPLRKFLTFCLSPDHWQEELEYMKPWAEAVKQLSPQIYAEMMLDEGSV